VASSVLRAKGFEAESVRGGFNALLKVEPGLVGERRMSGSDAGVESKADSVMEEKSDSGGRSDVEGSDGEGSVERSS
jgi:hypothetical protein